MLVPFGGADHDWAALELGAWVASSYGAPLRLLGAAGDDAGRRDASRLLGNASLVLQQLAGVAAEPLLIEPGREGVLRAAEGAGLLVIGLSERWRDEGLGPTRAEIARSAPGPRPCSSAAAATRVPWPRPTGSPGSPGRRSGPTLPGSRLFCPPLGGVTTFCVDSQPDPDIQIAGYRIEARVGRGGMGEVYRAVQLSLGRRVALKVLAPELADDDLFRRRFLRESRIAASIDHPSVIPIYETRRGRRAALHRHALRRRLGPGDLAGAGGPPGAGQGHGHHDPGGQRAGRRPHPRAGPPRRQAGQHPAGRRPRRARAATVICATSGSSSRWAPSRRSLRSPPPTSSSARSRTWPPSRSRAGRSMDAPTSTRSAASCSTASPARCPTRARTTSRWSSPTFASRRRRSPAGSPACRWQWTRSSPGPWPKSRRTAARPARHWSRPWTSRSGQAPVGPPRRPTTTPELMVFAPAPVPPAPAAPTDPAAPITRSPAGPARPSAGQADPWPGPARGRARAPPDPRPGPRWGSVADPVEELPRLSTRAAGVAGGGSVVAGRGRPARRRLRCRRAAVRRRAAAGGRHDRCRGRPARHVAPAEHRRVGLPGRLDPTGGGHAGPNRAAGRDPGRHGLDRPVRGRGDAHLSPEGTS